MSSLSLYQNCAIAHQGTADAVLQCIADELEQSAAAAEANWNSWLLILAGALVFFMQAGFAMLCAGCVRKKNVQNTMLKNLLDACGAAIAFYCTGYAFAFGKTGDGENATFMGGNNFFTMGEDGNAVDPSFWFFQYAFSATSVTIVAGTLAERCQMTAYLCYSIFLTGFVYPVAARSVWSSYGFLSAARVDGPVRGVGVLDFAGSGVVHVTGGMTALIAAYMLGPRKGRFYDAKGRALPKPREFPGHSIALQLMGTMILWFGWYGFNPGSALLLGISDSGAVGALAAVNTSLAAGCGAIGALFTNLYLEERRTGDFSFSLTMAMNGLLGGLVAITAGCGTVEPWAACLIGLIAGWLYIGGSATLLHWKIDDAVDAIPVHFVNGLWGLISTGLFSTPRLTYAAFGQDTHVGWFYSMGRGSLDFTLLGNQLLAGLFLMSWPVVTMLPFFMWLNYMGWLRSDSLEELVGLDMAYHVGAAQRAENARGENEIDALLEDEEEEINREALQELHLRKSLKRREAAP